MGLIKDTVSTPCLNRGGGGRCWKRGILTNYGDTFVKVRMSMKHHNLRSGGIQIAITALEQEIGKRVSVSRLLSCPSRHALPTHQITDQDDEGPNLASDTSQYASPTDKGSTAFWTVTADVKDEAKDTAVMPDKKAR